MYIPRHFEDPAGFVLHEVLTEFPFATLVSLKAPLQVSHLPLLHVEDGSEHGKLIGHIAKPNPQASMLDGETPATAIFTGPHAYVSPNWYASENMVPTWNYAAVHAHGRPKPIYNPDAAAQVLDALVAAFESDATGNWRADRLPPRKMAGQLNGIVAFEMPVERFEIKAKMSQNRKEPDIGSVADALAASDRELDRQTADWMRRLNALGETGS